MKKSVFAVAILAVCLFAGKTFAQQGTFLQTRLLPDTATGKPFRFLPPVLPANYATQCYGFFCRQELKLDKVTPLPLRFRLGSVEETDRMEGKRR